MIDKTLKPYSDNWPLLLEASRVDDEHLYAAALAVLRYAKRTKQRITNNNLRRRHGR